jgi:Flp pilus assembly pilin Flp
VNTEPSKKFPTRREKAMTLLGNEKGAMAVEYGLLVAGIAIVVMAAIYGIGIALKEAQFDKRGYVEVSLKKLHENPAHFGEGAKLAVVGYTIRIEDHRSQRQPVKIRGKFLYNLQKRQERSHYRNPEIPILTLEGSLPFRVKAWGILKKEKIAGREYCLEVKHYQLWEQ